MAGRMDMSRIRESITKIVHKVSNRILQKDSQALNAKADAQAAEVIEPTAPLWQRRSIQLIGGAIILLVTTGIIGVQQYQQYIKNNTFEIFHVYKDGVEIGTVDNKEQVEQLVAKKKYELENDNPGIQMVLNTGDITYKSETALKLYAETEATLSQLNESFTSHAEGVAVVVDGKTIGIVKDEETAAKILNRVQSEYAPSIAAEAKNNRTITSLSFNEADQEEAKKEIESNKPGKVVTEVGFVEAVDVESVSVSPSDIIDADAVYNTIIEGSTKPTKYVVQPGDCIGCIAYKFDISDQVIYENNPWITGDRITVGDELDLTVRRPEITVHTTETQIEIEEIAIPIEYVKNDEMKKGETKTIQTGTAGSQKLVYSVYRENGYIISEELVNKEVILEATPTIIEKGTLVIAGTGTGQFSYPVSNYRLSSKYGSRWGRSHKGIDLTGDKGIKAADAGQVEFVGIKNGYGNTIIIDHKNGFKTLYGHLNSYGVSKGDKVDKGDKIGIMGNTGRSTGVHLHFEIIKNGTNQNPLSYL